MFELTTDDARDYFILNETRWPQIAALAYGCYRKLGRGYIALNLIGHSGAYYPKEHIDSRALDGFDAGAALMEQIDSYDPAAQVVCLMNAHSSDGETVSAGVYSGEPTPKDCWEAEPDKTLEKLVESFQKTLVMQ